MAQFDRQRLLDLQFMFSRFNYAFDNTLARFPIMDKHVIERDLVRMITRGYKIAINFQHVDLRKTYQYQTQRSGGYRPIDSIVFCVLALGAIDKQESGEYVRLAFAVEEYFKGQGGIDSVILPMFNILYALYLAFQENKIEEAVPFIQTARRESEIYFCHGSDRVSEAQGIIKDVHTNGVPLMDGPARETRIQSFEAARDILKRNQSFADIFKTCYVLELHLLGAGIITSLPSCECDNAIFKSDQDNTDATDGPWVRRAKCLWYLHQCLRANKEKWRNQAIHAEALAYVNRLAMPWDYAINTRESCSFPHDVDEAIDKATVHGCRFIMESIVVADHCWNCGCRKLNNCNTTCANCDNNGINSPSWDNFPRLQKMYFSAEYAVMAFINVSEIVPTASLKFYGFIARCAISFITGFQPCHYAPEIVQSLYACWDDQHQLHRYEARRAQQLSGLNMYGQ